MSDASATPSPTPRRLLASPSPRRLLGLVQGQRSAVRVLDPRRLADARTGHDVSDELHLSELELIEDDPASDQFLNVRCRPRGRGAPAGGPAQTACDGGLLLELPALSEQLLVLVAGERALDEAHKLVALEAKLPGHRRQVRGATVDLAVAHHRVDARLDVRPRLTVLAWMEVTQLP